MPHVQADVGRGAQQNAGVDGRPHRTLGCSPGLSVLAAQHTFTIYNQIVGASSFGSFTCTSIAQLLLGSFCFFKKKKIWGGRGHSDVRGLAGERPADVLGRPPAHPLEERREAVAPPQPGALPETGGERRTVKGFFFFFNPPSNVCLNQRSTLRMLQPYGKKDRMSYSYDTDVHAIVFLGGYTGKSQISLYIFWCSTTLCHNFSRQHCIAINSKRKRSSPTELQSRSSFPQSRKMRCP